MEVSFNELDARLKKAARGAGLSWGLAEEFAKALLYLAQSNIALDCRVVEFLEDPSSVELLSDWCYQLDLGLPLEASGGLSQGQQQVLEGFVRRANRPVASFSQRASVDSEAWERLRSLEFKTYAPESEISRLKGAGAGVSDND